MGPLLRIGAWGFCALVALGTVVLAGRTEMGEQRIAEAVASFKSSTHAANTPTPESEAARLAETVRVLAADRDRLTTRVAALEQYLTELTGSIAREKAASGSAPATATPATDEKPENAPGPVAAMAPPSAPAGETPLAPTADTPASGMTVNVPLPRPSPMAQIQSYISSGTRTAVPPEPETRVAAVAEPKAEPPAAPEAKEFAIDLAAASNVNALRARWGTIRGAHPALLEGLRPLVSVRESQRPGFSEFHLVAG